MNLLEPKRSIIDPDELILVTGAAGFIGRRVVYALLTAGFRNLRCHTRPFSRREGLNEVIDQVGGSAHVDLMSGNLLSREDCAAAAHEASLVFHLAAGKGEKSFADAYANSVVTTRNLLDACVASERIRRFVNISSLAVYRNRENPSGRLLDEASPMESHPELRHNSYCFAKTEQDKLVMDYAERFGLRYVLIRPGWVYGSGSPSLHGRIGIGTFGIFLHLGGGNTLPLTYVDNCAEAIALAGTLPGSDNQVFNVVDDDLPSSRKMLKLYKRNVRRFRSIYVPHALSYTLCSFWENYCQWSQGQLPPVYNRNAWTANWKRTRFSNAKLKSELGWLPSVSTREGLQRFFESGRAGESHA